MKKKFSLMRDLIEKCSVMRDCYPTFATLYPRSCKRTPEQWQLLREETRFKVPKQRHRNQDHCIRKRPRKSTTVRSVLHTKLQTCPQLLRGMQQIRGPFILIIILTYLETLCTLTLTPHILSLFTRFYFTSVYKPYAEYFFLSLMMP